MILTIFTDNIIIIFILYLVDDFNDKYYSQFL